MRIPPQNHDLTLPAWGPYTKKYSGISHIPAAGDGVRFDLAVFPGFYRRRVDLPNVTFESGYHVWAAAPDLSCYTLRHELEWKDRVYADISFAPLGPDARLIRAELCNRTDAPQNLVLHYMASAWDPTPAGGAFPIPGPDVRLPPAAAYCQARDYEELRFARPRPDDHLVFDGLRRGEVPVEGFTIGYGVGFGGAAAPGPRPRPDGAGDAASYRFTLPAALEEPWLGVRYRNPGPAAAGFTVSGPAGQSPLPLPPAETPAMAWAPLAGPLPAGDCLLTLAGAGTGCPQLDCLVLCDRAGRQAVHIGLRGPGARPALDPHPDEGFLTLQYPHIRECYGLLWTWAPAELRQIENDELDIFLRYTVHDHVSATLRGNGRGHYANVFQRPIPLAPGETRVIYGAVCCADTPAAAAACCRRLAALGAGGFAAAWQAAAAALAPPPALPAGRGLQLGQQLMQAVLCTNVVYPVYTRGQYIRHNTPGRWWDSLYTWDSGFIGIGLAQYSLRRAFDCLNAYLTPVEDDEAAFIFHGSLVPTQFYLFAELLNRTGSLELAAACYPRLRRYYAFLTGQAEGSTTADLAGGLLRPWDYFYNSGGWDDYPPQREVHRRGLERCCTPVITTAHAIRCARILAYTARRLGRDGEADALLADARRFTDALQRHAWDGQAGYFGYLLHDRAGQPQGLLRDENGVNFNMGLGGASPLFAGACTPDQAAGLWAKLQDDTRLWSRCGLSTVDQSAPYYRQDGYWNGAVWMPYQWMFFKAALDAGLADFAFRIADTALRLWQTECARSYHCFEHFMIESGRGAGWHQFGGLSAPVVHWYAAYYRPGTLTTGFDTFVRRASWRPDHTGLTAELDATRPGRFTLLAALAPGAVRLTASAPAGCARRHDGLWEITFTPDAPGPITFTLEP